MNVILSFIQYYWPLITFFLILNWIISGTAIAFKMSNERDILILLSFNIVIVLINTIVSILFMPSETLEFLNRHWVLILALFASALIFLSVIGGYTALLSIIAIIISALLILWYNDQWPIMYTYLSELDVGSAILRWLYRYWPVITFLIPIIYAVGFSIDEDMQEIIVPRHWHFVASLLLSATNTIASIIYMPRETLPSMASYWPLVLIAFFLILLSLFIIGGYASLSGIAAVVSALLIILYSDQWSNIYDYLVEIDLRSNILTESVSILITIAVIERLMQFRHSLQLRQLRSVAGRRISVQCHQILVRIADWYENVSIPDRGEWRNRLLREKPDQLNLFLDFDALLTYNKPAEWMARDRRRKRQEDFERCYMDPSTGMYEYPVLLLLSQYLSQLILKTKRLPWQTALELEPFCLRIDNLLQSYAEAIEPSLATTLSQIVVSIESLRDVLGRESKPEGERGMSWSLAQLTLTAWYLRYKLRKADLWPLEYSDIPHLPPDFSDTDLQEGTCDGT